MVDEGNGNIFCVVLGADLASDGLVKITPCTATEGPADQAYFDLRELRITSRLDATPLAVDVDDESESAFIPPYGIYKPVRSFPEVDERVIQQVSPADWPCTCSEVLTRSRRSLELPSHGRHTFVTKAT
jgi:hypothetical protein